MAMPGLAFGVHDVSYLLHKEGIVGELERFLAVGLQREGLEPSVRGTF